MICGRFSVVPGPLLSLPIVRMIAASIFCRGPPLPGEDYIPCRHPNVKPSKSIYLIRSKLVPWFLHPLLRGPVSSSLRREMVRYDPASIIVG